MCYLESPVMRPPRTTRTLTDPDDLAAAMQANGVAAAIIARNPRLFPDHIAPAGGSRSASGAVAGVSPFPLDLAGVAPTAPASLLATRDGALDGDVYLFLPHCSSAVTSHLSAGVAGFEQRDASGPTTSIHPTAA